MEEIKMDKKEKVVLAYSGGLDTSVIIPWLKENYDFEVIAVSINIGQKDDFEAIAKKAKESGASKFFAIDKTKELVEEYIFPMLKSGAKYENNSSLAYLGYKIKKTRD